MELGKNEIAPADFSAGAISLYRLVFSQDPGLSLPSFILPLSHDRAQKLQVIGKNTKSHQEKGTSSQKALTLYYKNKQKKAGNADQKQERDQNHANDSNGLGNLF